MGEGRGGWEVVRLEDGVSAGLPVDIFGVVKGVVDPKKQEGRLVRVT